MKKFYEEPVIDVLRFDVCDVITASDEESSTPVIDEAEDEL